MNNAERSPELERLAELAERGARDSVSEAERRLSRQAFMEKVDAELTSAARREGWRRHLSVPVYWPVPALLVVAAAVALFVMLPRGMSYEVVGAASEGGYVSAPANRSVEVRFSDRTSVVASAGSRLRIEDSTSRGARVLLERGSTNVHVVHARDTDWSFVAGPFDVRVTGTRFELTWDPAAETIELVLIEGSVEVRAFAGSGPVAVRTGQRFRGDALRRSMVVTDAAAKEAPPPSEAQGEPAVEPLVTPEVAPVAPGEPHPADPSKVQPKDAHAPRESWQKLIAQGKFARIVDEATERGVSSCLEACSAADLRALADAARYTSRGDLAEQSLLALRKRFAGDAGRGAAFLLGRLYEARGKSGNARTWYESYLRESPGGDFASEALAGKMRMVDAIEGRKSAEPIAREYLNRYPTGVHAKTARQIAGAH